MPLNVVVVVVVVVFVVVVSLFVLNLTCSIIKFVLNINYCAFI